MKYIKTELQFLNENDFSDNVIIVKKCNEPAFYAKYAKELSHLQKSDVKEYKSDIKNVLYKNNIDIIINTIKDKINIEYHNDKNILDII